MNQVDGLQTEKPHTVSVEVQRVFSPLARTQGFEQKAYGKFPAGESLQVLTDTLPRHTSYSKHLYWRGLKSSTLNWFVSFSQYEQSTKNVWLENCPFTHRSSLHKNLERRAGFNVAGGIILCLSSKTFWVSHVVDHHSTGGHLRLKLSKGIALQIELCLCGANIILAIILGGLYVVRR